MASGNPLMKRINELEKQLKQAQNQIANSRQAKFERAVRIAARERLQASMYSAVFANLLASMEEDIDNARTHGEVVAWVKNDLIARFKPVFEQSEYDEREQILEQCGIEFNKENLMKNLDQNILEIMGEISNGRTQPNYHHQSIVR